MSRSIEDTQSRSTAGAPPASPGSGINDAAPGDFIRWARDAARPISDESLIAAAGEARVVALGEFMHGAHEPLEVRNRMIKVLANRGLISAVAMETGLVEGRRLNEFVMGGPGDPAEIARRYLNWGFGQFSENVDLLNHLRHHNSRPGVLQVGLHGIDVPGGINFAIGDVCIAINDTIDYLRRTGLEAVEIINELSAHTNGLTLAQYFELSLGGQHRIFEAATRARRLLTEHRSACVAATSQEEFEWGKRTAVVLSQVIELFQVWPRDNKKGNSARGMHPVAQFRDAVMAENFMWHYGRQGSEGRILLFAANTHVVTGIDLGPVNPEFPGPIVGAGRHLKEQLGSGMRVVLTAAGTVAGVGGSDQASAENEPDSLARRLAEVGHGPFILNIDEAPSEARLDEPTPLGAHMAPLITPPRQSFDSVIYFPAATNAGLASTNGN